jgi:hypothetical protein
VVGCCRCVERQISAGGATATPDNGLAPAVVVAPRLGFRV